VNSDDEESVPKQPEVIISKAVHFTEEVATVISEGETKSDIIIPEPDYPAKEEESSDDDEDSNVVIKSDPDQDLPDVELVHEEGVKVDSSIPEVSIPDDHKKEGSDSSSSSSSDEDEEEHNKLDNVAAGAGEAVTDEDVSPRRRDSEDKGSQKSPDSGRFRVESLSK